MNGLKRLFIGLAAAGALAGAAELMADHKRDAKLEELCEKNGLALDRQDPQEALLKQKVLYSPTFPSILGVIPDGTLPHYFMLVESQDGDVYFCRSKVKSDDGDQRSFNGVGPNIGGTFYPAFTHDGKTAVDLNFLESQAARINRSWGLYVQNNERFKADAPDWQFGQQVVYNIFDGIPPESREQAILEEMRKTTLAHEKQHREDGEKFPELDKELRGTCRELMISPLGFVGLEAGPLAYRVVAENIFNHLYGFTIRHGALPLRDKRDLAQLRPTELRELVVCLVQDRYQENWN